MATYYSVKDSDLNLGTINNSFGLSLSSLEVINSNTTDVLLLTSFQTSPTLILNQNVSASYVALNTSNRSINPSGTLDLNITINNNNGVTTSTSQSYPISSFAQSTSWNLLKLTNVLSANSSQRLNVSVKTSQPNQLSIKSIFSALTALDDTRNNSISSVNNSVTLSSVTIGGINTNSFFLNGTNNWMNVPASPLFNFNGDFTIEFWINTLTFNTDTGARRILGFGIAASNNLEIALYDGTNPSNKISLFNNGNLLAGTSAVADGNWHHVAITRYANTLKLFVDGGQSGLAVANTTIFNTGTASPMSIGVYNNASTNRLSGYIANLRIIKDLAVYTQPFTVPSIQSVSATPETVFLLKDGTLNNFNRMLINEPNNLFNRFNGSGYFNGSSSYLSLPPISFGTSDFCIESWIYPISKTQNFPALFSNYNTTGGGSMGIFAGHNSATNTKYVVDINGTNFPAIVSTSNIVYNTWTHVALTRENGSFKLFINGVQEGAIYTPGTNPTLGTALNTTIGRSDSQTTASHFNGYISNYRIVIRQSIYTNNFTPATRFLELTDNGGATPSTNPILNNVTLLTLRNNSLVDISNNGFTITNNNVNINNDYTDLYVGGLLSGTNTEIRTITADTFTLSSLSINNQGTLTFPLTSNKTLTLVGSAGLEINSGATLNIGTSSASIPLSTTHTINLSNTEINVNDGGTFNVYGFPETTTTSLVSTHPIGSRVFTVTSTVSNNWRVGDILAFKPNLTVRTSFDTLILSSFTGPSTFTTTSSSLCTHTGSNAAYSFIPDVYNLTRNVKIQGSSSTSRGVIKTIGASKTNINYAQLNNLGLGGVSYDTGLELYHNSLGNFTLSGSVFYNNTTKLFNTSRVAARLFTNTPANTYLRGLSSIGTIGTGNFTAEAWIYPTGRAALSYVLDLSDVGPILTAVRPSIYLDNTGLVYYRADNNSGNLITSTNAVPLNVWTHVAVSKISGSTKLFINGVQSSSAYSDSKNYITSNPLIGIGGPSTLNGTDFAWPMLGFISKLRVSFEGIYNNTFTPTWNLPNLSSTKLLLFSDPMERNIIDSSSLKIPFTNVGGISASTLTRGTNNLFNLDNTKINNNILSGTNFSLTNTSITGSLVEIKDNSILSTVLTGGLILRDVSGSINMSNNRTVGALGHGTHLFNTSLTGTYGALNYNSALQGMIISGANTGTIVGGGINSPREGVYVDASVNNLNNVTFQNIIANDNSNVGFKVSGNNLNYLTPVILNINGLTANNNINAGFEGYNITGSLTSIVANNNYLDGIRTSIGNGSTILDGVSSTMSTIMSTVPLIANGTVLSETSPFDPRGWSGYFNGSSRLTVARNASLFPIANENFTIEFWLYPLSFASTPLIVGFEVSGVNSDWWVKINTNGTVSFRMQTANATFNSTSALQLSAWNHCAIVRSGTSANNCTFFYNGSATNSFSTNQNTNNNRTYNLTIGADSNGAIPYTGYISNLRIIKGRAIYTTNFTPPTAAFEVTNNGGAIGATTTPLLSNVSLLTLQNNRFIDNSSNNFTLSADGLPSIQAVSPFTPVVPYSLSVHDGSISFNGTSDHLVISNPNAQSYSGVGDFTFESWIYTNDSQWDIYGNNSSSGLVIGYNILAATNGLCIGRVGVGLDASTGVSNAAVAGLSSNTWQHIAISKISNVVNFFINGKLIASPTSNVNYAVATQSTIGKDPLANSLYFNGLISNLRFTNGIGLYTQDFTPSTSPLNLNLTTIALLKSTYYLSNSIVVIPTINRATGLNILSGYNYGQTVIKNVFLSATSLDPALSAAVGLNMNVDKLEEFRLEGSTLSATTPLQITSTRPKLEGSYLFHNSNSSAYNLSSLALTGYQTDSYKEGITVMRENRLNGNHYKYTGAGSISFDTVNVNSPNTVSERLTPWSVNTKLRSTSKLIPINTGESLTVSVTLQRSSGYTGAAPRLILVGNASLGYSDSVLATSNLTSGWKIITGTIPASLNIGVVEVYVDCSGNVGSGYINIDSWDFY